MRAAPLSALLLLLSYVTASWAVSLRSRHVQRKPLFLQGLQIGSFSGGVDVVVNGKLQKRWSRRTPMDVDAKQHRTNFWLRWHAKSEPSDGTESGGVAFNVSLMSIMPSIATGRLQAIGPETKRDQQSHWSLVRIGRDATELAVDYECLTHGFATMVLTLEHGNSSSLQLHFRKQCGAAVLSGVSLGTDGLGLHTGTEDIACNGLSRWPTQTVADRIIASAVNHLDLFWLLRPSGGLGEVKHLDMVAPKARALQLECDGMAEDAECEQHWKGLLSLHSAHSDGARLDSFDGVAALVASLEQKPLTWQGRWGHDGDIVSVSFLGPGASGGVIPVSEGARRTPLRANLYCHRKGLALVEVELSAGVKFQPFKPIALSFLKVCGDPQHLGFDVIEVGDVNVEIVHDGRGVAHLPVIDNKRNRVQLFWRDIGASNHLPVQSRVACDAIASVQMQDATMESGHDATRLSGAQEMRFQCQQPGDATCWLQFGWNNSQSAMLEFRKACGGKASDVSVTAGVGDAPSGTTKPTLLQGSLLPSAVELPIKKSLANFTIALTKDRQQGEQLVRLGHPKLRVSSEDVVHASVAAYAPTTLATTEDLATLAVQTDCKRSGSAQVDVDVPIGDGDLGFDPLHFVINKQCVVRSVWTQEWTGVMVCLGVVFTVSLLLLSSCVTRFRQTSDK